MIPAKFLNNLGRVPVLANALRWYARHYEEGSVVTIQTGHVTGMKWRRYHRYVNGYWTGVYELPLQNAFVREIASGDVIYDIGANAGFFTILAAKLTGRRGHVYAFEPVPENTDSVQQQIAVNGLKQVELVIMAVSDRCGEALFTLTDNTSTPHITYSNKDQGMDERQLTVRTVTLDEFALNHSAPDFIKLDVEGAETEVLRGADDLLSSDQAPKLLIELHGDDKAQSVGAILTEHNYTICDLDGKPLAKGTQGQHHVLAYPPQLD